MPLKHYDESFIYQVDYNLNDRWCLWKMLTFFRRTKMTTSLNFHQRGLNRDVQDGGCFGKIWNGNSVYLKVTCAPLITNNSSKRKKKQLVLLHIMTPQWSRFYLSLWEHLGKGSKHPQFIHFNTLTPASMLYELHSNFKDYLKDAPYYNILISTRDQMTALNLQWRIITQLLSFL